MEVPHIIVEEPSRGSSNVKYDVVITYFAQPLALGYYYAIPIIST